MLPLYENIKNRRESLNLSQEQLAERTGYTSRSSIAKIEKGLVDLPLSKIEVFADALETTPSELMGDTWEESYILDNARLDVINAFDGDPYLIAKFQEAERNDAEKSTGYYLDPEAAEIAQEVQARPEMDNSRLQNLMKEKGYNTAMLAELSGLSVSTVNKIVYGIAKNPTLGNVQAIAKALGCTLDELVSYDPNEPDTIAAHHDGEDWTKEELEEIENFKKYVKSKRG